MSNEKKVFGAVERIVTIVIIVSAMCYAVFVWYKVKDEYNTWENSLKIVSELQKVSINRWKTDLLESVENIAKDPVYASTIASLNKGDKSVLYKSKYPVDVLGTASQVLGVIVKGVNDSVLYSVGNVLRFAYNIDSRFGNDNNKLQVVWDNALKRSVIKVQVPIVEKNKKYGDFIVFVDPEVKLFELIRHNIPETTKIKTLLTSVSGNTICDIDSFEVAIYNKTIDDNKSLQYKIVETHKNQKNSVEYCHVNGKKMITVMSALSDSNWVLVTGVMENAVRDNWLSTVFNGFFIMVLAIFAVALTLIILKRFIGRGVMQKLLKREANLRAQTRELEIILKNISEAIITTDKNGRIWHINNRGEQLTGYSKRQVLGRAFSAVFVTHTDAESDEEITFDVLFKKSIILCGSIELPSSMRLVQKDGNELPIVGSVSPIINDLKMITGFVVSFNDNSDKYYKMSLMAQGIDSYSLAFDNNPHPMCIYDTETFQFQAVNKAGCELAQRTREELLQKTLFDISAPQLVMILKNANKDVSEKFIDSNEWVVQRRNGELVTMDKKSFSVTFNGKPCRSVILTDLVQVSNSRHDSKSAQKQYQSVVNVFPEPIVIIDTECRITFVNKHALELFGATRESELIGYNLSYICNVEIYDSIKVYIGDLISTMKPQGSIERSLVKLDGSYFNAEIIGVPYDALGDISIQLVIRDVNEHNINVQRAISDNEYRNIGNLGNIHIWKLDADFNLVYTNDAFDRFVGKYSGTLLSNTDWVSLIHPDERATRFENLRKSCESREFIQTELRLLCANGNYYWMLVCAAPNFDSNGKYLGYMGYNININRRRLAELGMEKAMQKAEESAQLKATFLSTLSHEIRTPMNAIVGFTDLLKESDSPINNQRYVSIIQKNAYQLLSIITDTVEMSKIDSNQITLNIDYFKLRSVVDDVFADAKQRQDKGLIMTINNQIPADLKVKADRFKIKQIIYHLLDNAIKYTPSGSVTLDANIEADDFVITISDTGIGVSDKDKKFLYERFFRIDNNETIRERGLGLGLPICKAYTDVLGGTLKFESTINVGTIVTVSLPYMQFSDVEKTNIVSASPFVNKKGCILLADNDEYNAIYLNTILEENGYKVKVVFDGETAVKAIKTEENIKLVLLDVNLGILNGFDTFLAIREFNKTIPIVAQSSFSRPEIDKKIKEFDFNGVLRKPILKDMLIEEVERQLSVAENC